MARMPITGRPDPFSSPIPSPLNTTLGTLGWWVNGASIFASNIGSEHIVGLAAIIASYLYFRG
ncbi:MAG: hypothetical protein WAL87_01520 [Chthoniobacterales bacterium]